jgi:hypothetical protein
MPAARKRPADESHVVLLDDPIIAIARGRCSMNRAKVGLSTLPALYAATCKYPPAELFQLPTPQIGGGGVDGAGSGSIKVLFCAC